MKFELGKSDPKLLQYIAQNKKRLAKAQRMFGIEVYRQLTIATPVDTGRARWGWNCSIGSENAAIPPEAPGHVKNYYGLDAGRAAAEFTVTGVTGKDSIFISNAVPYIVKLNEGYSKQAPARFFELAFENAVQKLARYYKGSTLKFDK